jgi:hypothetical protein
VTTSSSAPTGARFDRFIVDFSNGGLLRSGVRVPIQGQPLQVLRVLLEAAGKVVAREELRQALWPEDTFVDFELGVNTAVKKLRQALLNLVQNALASEGLALSFWKVALRPGRPAGLASRALTVPASRDLRQPSICEL